MHGLQKLCKAYGAMTVNGTKYLWDYVADKAVPESDMRIGSDRWQASERKRCAELALAAHAPLRPAHQAHTHDF